MKKKNQITTQHLWELANHQLKTNIRKKHINKWPSKTNYVLKRASSILSIWTYNTIFLIQIWQIWAVLPITKFLWMGWNHVFQVEVRPKFANKKENTSRDHFNEYVEQFFTNLHPKDVVHVMCWKKFVLKSSSKICCACNVLGKKLY